MRLMPKQEVFRTLFIEFSILLEQAATDLNDAIQKDCVMKDTADLMLKRELEADHLGMRLYNALHKSFITPHDPEDIFSLIQNLDDVMDGIEDIAHRLSAYNIKPIPDGMRKLAEHILVMVRHIKPALIALETNKQVVESCVVLKHCETEMDMLTRDAIAELFVEQSNPIELIKLKETYEFFEETANACAHVAAIIGRIHIKGG